MISGFGGEGVLNGSPESARPLIASVRIIVVASVSVLALSIETV
jgi:hypothetical protein